MTVPKVEQYAGVDTTLHTVSRGLALPGIAVGVFSKAGLSHVWTSGVLDMCGTQPVTAHTRFHTASVTKPLVATAVMQLVEQGLVALEAPAQAYLPYFTVADDRVSGVTVVRLLSHTAGMPDVTDYEWDRPQVDDEALERHVRSLADRSLLFAPGESWAYSNLGYEILGDLIAKVAGESFEEYVTSHILRPLGMIESTWRALDVDPALRARGHSLDASGTVTPNDVYPYNRSHAPSSGLCSTVADMARWGAFWLGEDDVGAVPILQDITKGRMIAPCADIAAPTVRVGLGWILSSRGGVHLIGHPGSDLGFRSYLLLAPTAGSGVVLMINCDAWWIDMASLAFTILGNVLDG